MIKTMFFSYLLILCAFFHRSVFSDHIIKRDTKTANSNDVYVKNRTNFSNRNECHKITGCLNVTRNPNITSHEIDDANFVKEINDKEIKPTKSDVNKIQRSISSKRIYNFTDLHDLRKRRRKRDINYDYVNFYKRIPRYESYENMRPWPHHPPGPPFERPEPYGDPFMYRHNEPYRRSLWEPHYVRQPFDEDLAHRIEPRSSPFGSTRPDAQAEYWPPSRGGPPIHGGPPPNRGPPPPPYGPPPNGRPPPPPYGPPPHEPFHPYEISSRGVFQNRGSPMPGRQSQQGDSPSNLGPSPNWKDPPRVGDTTSVEELIQPEEATTINEINSDTNVNNTQENINNADINDSTVLENNDNNNVALVNNNQANSQPTRPHLYFFQVQPVTPEE